MVRIAVSTPAWNLVRAQPPAQAVLPAGLAEQVRPELAVESVTEVPAAASPAADMLAAEAEPVAVQTELARAGSEVQGAAPREVNTLLRVHPVDHLEAHHTVHRLALRLARPLDVEVQEPHHLRVH